MSAYHQLPRVNKEGQTPELINVKDDFACFMENAYNEGLIRQSVHYPEDIEGFLMKKTYSLFNNVPNASVEQNFFDKDVPMDYTRGASEARNNEHRANGSKGEFYERGKVLELDGLLHQRKEDLPGGRQKQVWTVGREHLRSIPKPRRTR